MKTNLTQNLTYLSRAELIAVATKLGLPKGKSRADTQRNVAKAITDGKARFSVTVTIRSNDNPKSSYAPMLFGKKFRTHKPDKVLTIW